MDISILVNNYNYANYIDKCIDSINISNNKYNVEIIVYDDGSNDTSLEVLKRYQDKILLIKNKNYGHSPNINQANAIYQAFLHSTGEIICLLDSDDYFNSEKIDKVFRLFKENQSYDVIQHQLAEVDLHGNLTGAIVPVLKKVIDYRAYINNTESLFHLFSTTSSLCFRRRFLEKVLPLKEDDCELIWADTRLMQIASLTTKILTINEPLSYYRIHGENNFANKLGNEINYKKYVDQLYAFFNSQAKNNNFPCVEFSETRYLENTFFYNNINDSKVIDFLNNVNDSYIMIWGAGEAGQSVLHALQKKKKSIQGFIDNDSRKWGSLIMGKPVISPEEVTFISNTRIIVSPYHAYDAIKSILERNNLNEGYQFIDPYIR